MFYYDIDFSFTDSQHCCKQFKKDFLDKLSKLDPKGFAMHKDNAAYRGADAHNVMIVRGVLRKLWRDGRQRYSDGWYCFRGLASNADALESIVDLVGPENMKRIVELDDGHHLMLTLAIEGQDFRAEGARREFEEVVDGYVDDMVARGRHWL